MTEVQAVRAALEQIRFFSSGKDPAFALASAFVTEGLAACNELENAPDQPLIFTSAMAKVELIASILRKAGLL